MNKDMTIEALSAKIDSQSAEIKQLIAEVKEMKNLLLQYTAHEASEEVMVPQEKETVKKPFFVIDDDLDESGKERIKKMTDEGRKMVYAVFDNFYSDRTYNQRLNDVLDKLFEDGTVLFYLRLPQNKKSRRFARDNGIDTTLFNYNCVRCIIYYLVIHSRRLFGSEVKPFNVMQGVMGVSQYNYENYNTQNPDLVHQVEQIIEKF